MGKRAVAAFLVLGAFLLHAPAAAQENMKAAPALDPALLQSGPARQDECYRWGWRGWGRYKNCSCVKCSWKLAPSPQRFCWRIC